MDTQTNSKKGLIVSVVIVVLAVVAGIMLFRTMDKNRTPVVGPEHAEADQTTMDIKTQSSSDELSDIEADLSATSVDKITEEPAVQ